MDNRSNSVSADAQLKRKLESLSPEKRALVEQLLAKKKQEKLQTARIVPLKDRSGKHVLSYAQQRLWSIDQLLGKNSYYNIPVALQLNGRLNQAALEKALATIIERHQSLRTAFSVEDGHGVQQVVPIADRFRLDVDDLTPLGQSQALQAVEPLMDNAANYAFDLTAGLLLKASLWLLDSDTAILLIVIHHIAADGWSMSVLFNELSALYEAYVKGEENPLPSLAIQYIDYAVWQRTFLAGPVLKKQLDYWQQQLQGLPRLHNLPLDKTRPAQQRFQGAILKSELPAYATKQLKMLCRQQNATLFMGIYAALSMLLSRYSGEVDVVVGTTAANRDQSEVSGLIGFFINSLVLRTDLSTNPTFTELLTQCKSVALGAFAHQQVPFEQLVDELKLPRDLSYHPLFQIMLAVQNNQEAEINMAGLSISEAPVRASSAKFDLTLNVDEQPNGLALDWEYNTDLFEATTINRLAAHFNQLLISALELPTLPVTQLFLLTEQEQQQLLQDWNPPSLNLPIKSVAQQFTVQAQATPMAVAVLMNNETLSYQQLEARANQLAHYLLAQGVTPCSLVGVCLPRSLNMVVATLAILKAGCAYVPLDPQYPEDRLQYLLSDSQVSWVLTESGLEQQLPLTNQQAVVLDSLDVQNTMATYPTTAPVVSVNEHSPAYVIYTSGSTGQPKGVVVPHRGILRLVLNNPEVPVDQSTVMLQSASVTFDAATLELWGPLLKGGQVVLYPEEVVAPAQLATCINQHQVNTIWLTSGLFDQWVAAELPAMPSLRYVLTGGDVVSPQSVVRCYQQYPQVTVINGYGPTENTTFTCCFPIPKDWPVEQPIPIGRPIGNTQVYVLDAYQQPVPIGVVGELYAGGDGVALAYLNNPALTAEKFVANPFIGKALVSKTPDARLYRTGDLVKWCADGTLAFMGRTDNQVKVRGFRIELGEVENALLSQTDVAEALVVVKATDTGSKRLVAYVVPADSASLADYTTSEQQANKLRDSLKQQLPDYMVPSGMVVLASFPLTSNGKVDRKALPEPQYELQQGYVAPTTEAETVLCEIWQQVLGVNPVGVNDNFFAIGGDSILAIQVASRTLRAGYQLSTRQVFEYQTIAELAKQLKVSQINKHVDHVVVGEQPLLPIQQAFLSGDEVDLHHFNQAMRITLPASVTEDQLRTAVQAIYKRHAVFRLSFQQVSQEQPLSWQGVYEEKLSEQAIQRSIHIVNSEADWDTLAYKAQTSLQLNPAPLSLLVWKPTSLTENRESELLWVIHHLIVDGVSWRILLQDLEYALNQLQQGKPIELGLGTSSFQQWGQRLIKYSQSEVLTQEKAYWQRVLSQPISVLPVDQPLASEADDTYQASAELTVSLNSATTQALLQQANQSYHTQINDLLLTALLLTITEWNRGQAIRLEMEGHGREALFEDIDLNETVGWFTSTYPVTLNRDTYELGSLIKSVKEQLRAIPNKGIGYGVLRYFNDDQQTLKPIEPIELVFNYLGQFDSHVDQTSPSPQPHSGVVLNGSFENTGPWVSHRRQRSHRLSISGLVSEGQLQLVWDYNRYQYNASTIQSLADNFFKHLTTIVEHCVESPSVYTPSDFPLAKIGSHQLDQLQADYPQLADLYPCTPMQQGMLFHSEMQPDSGVYITQLMLSFGAANPDHLQHSWQQLVARHAILRTAFVHLDQAQPLQLVQRQVELLWRTVDWRGLAAEAYQTEWAALLKSERETPFKLDQAPLMRLVLVQAADEQNHLIWTHHHALLDGWGVPILIQDLEALYCAHQQGLPAQLSPVVPYRQYIQWLQQQSLDAAKGYWQSYLKDFTEPSPLVVSQVDVHAAQSEGEFQFSLGEHLTAQLQQLAKQAQVTLSTVFQGAWGILLSRYCGVRDVVFGVTRSGRPETIAGVEDIVGLFINSVPLRVQFDESSSLGPWLQALQQSQASHDSYSYAPLVDIQKWSELSPGSQLFDTLLVVENFPMEEKLQQLHKDEAGLPITDLDGIEQSSLPLSVTITPGKTCHVRMLYQQDKFDDASVKRLSEQWQQLLIAMTSIKPHLLEKRVAQLSLLSVSEQQHISQILSQADIKSTYSASVLEQFERQESLTPHALAIVHNNQQLTYEALNKQANQLARQLVSMGVSVNQLVAICLPRSPEVVIAMLAVFKAGGAYLPMDPSYSAERNQHILVASEAGIVITKNDCLSHIIVEKQQLIILDEVVVKKHIETLPATNLNIKTNPENLAYVIYTSGSTGKPKGVAINQHNLAVSTQARYEFYQSPVSSYLLLSSFAFDSSVAGIYWTLCTGGKLCLPTDIMDLASLRTLLSEQQVSHLLALPSYYSQLLFADDMILPESLDVVILAGEACSEQVVKQHYTQTNNCDLVNEYGPTEGTIWATAKKLECDKALVTIGKSVGHIKTYVCFPESNPDYNQLCPVGVVGELWLGGEGVAQGYYLQPELTQQSFNDDPFSGKAGAKLYRTGDYVRRLNNGELAFVGRHDDQIKIRGFRVELKEIEALIEADHSVLETAVVCHESGQLIAFVAAKAEVPEGVVDGLNEQLRQQLPDYMRPQKIILIKRLPVNANGKVDRKLLTRYVLDETKDVYSAPATENEILLHEIWRSVLNKERISTEANFFAEGGDSIIAMQIASQSLKMGLKFSVGDLFEYPTIAGLAKKAVTQKVVKGHVNQKQSAVVRVTGEQTLLPVQQSFLDGDGDPIDRHHFNQALRMSLPNGVDETLLIQALTEVCQHHDVFRLRFFQTQGLFHTQELWKSSYQDNITVKDSVLKCDLTKVAVEDQEPLIERFANKVQASLSLQSAPLTKAIWLQFGNQQADQLIWILHHLIVDGVSLRLLTQHLLLALQQLLAKKAVDLGVKTTSYQLWGRQLLTYSQSDELQAQKAYWLKQLSQPVAPLPTDYPASYYQQDKSFKASSDVSVYLDRDTTTALLQKANQRYNTQVNDLLLTALMLSLTDWTRSTATRFSLEGHGREMIFSEINLNDTVGWFTSVFPVCLQRSAQDIAQHIQTVKRQLRTIPQKGLGFGVLRYLKRDSEVINAHTPSEVLFNYLGQFESARDDKHSDQSDVFGNTGAWISSRRQRPYKLGINAIVSSGCLQVVFNFSKYQYKEKTIKGLADSYIRYLQKIVAHCLDKNNGRDAHGMMQEVSDTINGLSQKGSMSKSEQTHNNKNKGKVINKQATRDIMIKLTTHNANQKTVYCFPGIGSTGIDFYHLANSLKNDVNLNVVDPEIFKTQDACLDWSSLTEMYLESFVDDQEYTLIGHSFGGCLATELAAHLERKNKNVRLVLLDTLLEASMVAKREKRDTFVIDHYIASLGLKSFFGLSTEQVNTAINGAGCPVSVLRTLCIENKIPEEFTNDFIHLSKRQMALYVNYQPSKLLTTKTAFLFSRNSFANQTFLSEVISRYKGIYHHLETPVQVSGDHFTMLKPDFVDDLADKIRCFISS
ncbi:non-ribosomal peptide synthetase [Zooshikella harenae]|uniref:Amino acid adenylation domain-containing protein n=1 Tax=Zooshikella harenae TaxID=2827238 RepID=A0ABS5ZGP5_9GAMM|nr:non-ribosomal peptide synthetase [Zooshikella harenae]MBU2713155.1 amino acid adenylation domain-containing protein [Zooshikella harenae]